MRKTTRVSTPRDIIKRAAPEAISGRAVRTVAKKFQIDRMTLKRFIEKFKSDDTITGYEEVAAKKAVFPTHLEKDLAEHVQALADMFLGLSISKCTILAYNYAVANHLPVPESWKVNGKAGTDWWLGFKSRNKLSARKPEVASFARATVFNRPMVSRFYDNLAEAMDSNIFEASDIFNCDETGCTTVQKPKEIVTAKCRKHVGAITSGERGELVTMVDTVNAEGNALPPLFIFTRAKYHNHFIRGSPPGSIGQTTRSGWINEDVVVKYLQHIIRHTRCSLERKILLILDNHELHTSLQAIDLAKSNGIVMVTIPPHASHQLQPLDRTVYGPFKAAYNRATDEWLRSHPGQTITIYDIPSIANEAHVSAMTPRNIVSGFASTGIYPFNGNLFTDTEFAPSAVTDRDFVNQAEQHPSCSYSAESSLAVILEQEETSQE